MISQVNKFNMRVVVATTVVALQLTCCNTFKLPLEGGKENVDVWPDTKSIYMTDEVKNLPQGGLNSIQERNLIKFNYPENNGQSVYPYDPEIISVRNQREGIKSEFVNYEAENFKRLERFYKQPPRMQGHAGTRSAERIIFPSEEAKKNSHSNADDEELKEPPTEQNLSIRSTPIPEELDSNNELLNKSQNDHSLESLAQIVRHLLFRMPIKQIPTKSSAPVSEESGEVKVTTLSTITQPEAPLAPSLEYVSDQSLYSGPKLRQSSSSSCPEGYKRTRNGSCQKPSRRLLST